MLTFDGILGFFLENTIKLYFMFQRQMQLGRMHPLDRASGPKTVVFPMIGKADDAPGNNVSAGIVIQLQ